MSADWRNNCKNLDGEETFDLGDRVVTTLWQHRDDPLTGRVLRGTLTIDIIQHEVFFPSLEQTYWTTEDEMELISRKAKKRV